MRRIVTVCTLCILLIGSLFVCGCAQDLRTSTDYTVRILLPDSSDYTFHGAQIIENGEGIGELSDQRFLDVRPGQDVRFAITPAEGMRIECTGDTVSYSQGYFTVWDVRRPATIRVPVKPIPKYKYTLNINDENCTVSSSLESGKTASEGTEITLTANVTEKQAFLGYSSGNFLNHGGELLTEEETYTLSLTKDTTIYANFADWSLWRLNYHTNKGINADGSEEVAFDAYSNSFYYCPNTRPDKGFFVRDGYILTGYNTEADGSGQYYGLGWNVVMPESGVIDLYCQWEKTTSADDFEYKVGKKNVTITGYTGEADCVVIPETICGKPVTVISENAFENASFTEVYIPRTVIEVDHKAFNACKSLQKIYFSDSVKTCYDDSFYLCTAFKTLIPQATEYPHANSAINFTYQVNYERLITRPGKIMLIVSGSCNVYGLNAKDVEDALGNEWDIITYSTIASTPATMYAEIGLHYMDENDILIFTPEASPYGHPWGTNYWEYYVWQVFEGAYDAIPLIDISNYTKVFSSFASFNQTRSKTKEKTYDYRSEHLNEYGEYVTFRPAIKTGSAWVKWNMEVFFTEENVKNYNRMLAAAKEKGLTPMIGWLASVAEEALVPNARIRENQLAYMNRAEELYDAYFFGDIKDYVYDRKLVHDQAMHLNTEGAVVRTKQVIKDIKAALIDLGLYEEE